MAKNSQVVFCAVFIVLSSICSKATWPSDCWHLQYPLLADGYNTYCGPYGITCRPLDHDAYYITDSSTMKYLVLEMISYFIPPTGYGFKYLNFGNGTSDLTYIDTNGKSYHCSIVKDVPSVETVNTVYDCGLPAEVHVTYSETCYMNCS